MTVTSGFSQYVEDAICAVFRGTAFPAVPSHFYLALFTTAPVNGVDSAAVECSGTGYQRLQFTPNTTNFAAPTGAAPATMLSGADLTMATPGSGGWGTVVGWALYDAANAGNMWAYGAFSGQAIAQNDVVKFPSGQLSITVQ